MATIQGVYMALFGRPADPLGLQFFSRATSNGANLTAIGDLAATAEYQGRFVGMSNSQIVTSIYQSLYNRAPDAAGLTFFTNALTSGSLNINNIAIAIYDGAQGADLVMRSLKEAAANAFTAAIDTVAEINGYSGTSAALSAVSFLSGVTTTAPTSTQINAAVLATMTSVAPGISIAMTNQLGETINGTAGNDTINSILNAASPTSGTGTFNISDIVNGGNGIDTMNITVTTAGNILPAGASISGVEIININQSQAAATSSATGIAANSFTGLQQLWQIDTTAGGGSFVDVTGVAAGVTVGFRGDGQSFGRTVVTEASTLNLAIDGILTGSGVYIEDSAVGSLRTVNVSGSTVAGASFGVQPNTTATAIETYNFALSSNSTAQVFTPTVDAQTNIKEVNLSGSTGNITFNSTAYTTSFEKLVGGSGNDSLTASNFNANAATLLVDGGAGNDTIYFDNSKNSVASVSTLTGGAGADTFVLTGGSNLVAVASNADLLASLTKIDFIAAEDTLSLFGMNGGAGLGPRVAQSFIDEAAIRSTGPDLLAITQAVAFATPAGQQALFQFGADTYLFGNISGVGLQNTDALIQLVGVNVASLNATNLIG